jgi:anti-sigma factor RsiW
MGNEHYLTEQDYELLSAYLDGELSASDQASLEARLQSEPLLRQELNSLRQTVAMIRQLATLRAPRNFTLTHAMLPPKKAAPRRTAFFASGMFSALSSAAAVVLVLLGVFLYGQQGRDALVAPMMMSMPPADSSQTARQAPVIIQTESEAPTMPALLGSLLDAAVADEESAQDSTEEISSVARSVAPVEADTFEGDAAPDEQAPIYGFAAAPSPGDYPLFEDETLMGEAIGGLIDTESEMATGAGETARQQDAAVPPPPMVAPLPQSAPQTESEDWDIIPSEPPYLPMQDEQTLQLESVALALVIAGGALFIVAAISGLLWWRQRTL